MSSVFFSFLCALNVTGFLLNVDTVKKAEERGSFGLIVVGSFLAVACLTGAFWGFHSLIKDAVQ